MEHKTTTAFSTKATDEGVVETVFAVMGNVDLGNDMIHPGAFSKTFQERGRKVKVLDHHQATSVRDVIGKPLELRELSRAELPTEVLDAYPEATGGAWARVQFLMDTPEGDGAFKRIKAGVVSEWSFGYDALDHDFSTVKQGDRDVTVRNLRTLKLWELSPVVFGMNPATATVSAKDAKPSEEKPWNIFEQDGQFCVYKISTQSGKPDGDPLGCHASQEEALEQMRALYANEPEAAEKEMIGDTPHARLGDVLQGSIHKIFTTLTDSWYVEGYMDREERIFLSSLIGDALDILSNGIPAEMASRQVYPFAVMGRALTTEEKAKDWEWLSELKESDVQRIMDRFDQFEEMLQARFVPAPEQEDHDAPPEEAADDTPMDEPAGPEIPPTEERLAAVEELRQEFEQLEV